VARDPISAQKHGELSNSQSRIILPIASALAHGPRVLCQFPSNKGVVTWLLGEKRGDYKRSTATHGIQQDSDSGVQSKQTQGFKEVKRNTVQAALDAVNPWNKSRHYGVNIALGGAGGINASSGNEISSNGEHGHLYVYVFDNDDAVSGEDNALLLGIEQSAPGRKDQYGGTHDIWTSAKPFSATGGDLLLKTVKVSKDLQGLNPGGLDNVAIKEYYDSMRVVLTEKAVAAIQEVEKCHLSEETVTAMLSSVEGHVNEPIGILGALGKVIQLRDTLGQLTTHFIPNRALNYDDKFLERLQEGYHSFFENLLKALGQIQALKDEDGINIFATFNQSLPTPIITSAQGKIEYCGRAFIPQLKSAAILRKIFGELGDGFERYQYEDKLCTGYYKKNENSTDMSVQAIVATIKFATDFQILYSQLNIINKQQASEPEFEPRKEDYPLIRELTIGILKHFHDIQEIIPASAFSSSALPEFDKDQSLYWFPETPQTKEIFEQYSPDQRITVFSDEIDHNRSLIIALIIENDAWYQEIQAGLLTRKNLTRKNLKQNELKQLKDKLKRLKKSADKLKRLKKSAEASKEPIGEDLTAQGVTAKLEKEQIAATNLIESVIGTSLEDLEQEVQKEVETKLAKRVAELNRENLEREEPALELINQIEPKVEPVAEVIRVDSAVSQDELSQKESKTEINRVDLVIRENQEDSALLEGLIAHQANLIPEKLVEVDSVTDLVSQEDSEHSESKSNPEEPQGLEWLFIRGYQAIVLANCVYLGSRWLLEPLSERVHPWNRWAIDIGKSCIPKKAGMPPYRSVVVFPYFLMVVGIAHLSYRLLRSLKPYFDTSFKKLRDLASQNERPNNADNNTPHSWSSYLRLG
jgi:hypothetical protein